MLFSDFITKLLPEPHSSMYRDRVSRDCRIVSITQYFDRYSFELWEPHTGLLWVQETHDRNLKVHRSDQDFYVPAPVEKLSLSIQEVAPEQYLKTARRVETAERLTRFIPMEEYNGMLMYVREHNQTLLSRDGLIVGPTFPASSIRMAVDTTYRTDDKIGLWLTPSEDRMFFKFTTLPAFKGPYAIPYLFSEDDWQLLVRRFQICWYQLPGYSVDRQRRYDRMDALACPLRVYMGFKKVSAENKPRLKQMIRWLGNCVAHRRKAIPVAVVWPGRALGTSIVPGSAVYTYTLILKTDRRYFLSYLFDSQPGKYHRKRKFILQAVDKPLPTWKDILEIGTQIEPMPGWTQEDVQKIAGEQILFGAI